MTFLAYPDTEHPAYADVAEAIRADLSPRRVVTVAEFTGPPPVAEWHADGDSQPVQPLSTRMRTLTVQKACGTAPYVGKPFIYIWLVAADELGRWVAGPSSIAYLPDWYE